MTFIKLADVAVEPNLVGCSEFQSLAKVWCPNYMALTQLTLYSVSLAEFRV